MKPKHKPAAAQPSKTAKLKLTPEHLQEFRFKHATLQMANQQALMVRESYQLFLSRILPQYGMTEADIDIVSGTIEPRGKNG